jgi:hypothetical protein
MTEQDEVNLEVAGVFDDMNVPYFLGGSLASSTHGIYRATADSDFIAWLVPAQAGDFVARLGDGYYSDTEAIRDAASRCGSFNVIHLGTMYKVDVFVPRLSEFPKSQMSRRVGLEVDGDGPLLYFASPEDTILSKLDWYRLGGETSDRQWNDILGVLKVQGDRLDFAYLDRWAAELRVADLLARARDDAGV